MDSARHRARRPWSYIYPRLLTDRALLTACGAGTVDQLWHDLSQQPFFISPGERAAVAARFLTEYPEARDEIIGSADAAMRHEFDLLGSGPQPLGAPLCRGTPTSRPAGEWPLAYCADIEYNELDRPTDVKVPWELSRCQHFIRLGQAYWSDRRRAVCRGVRRRNVRLDRRQPFVTTA